MTALPSLLGILMAILQSHPILRWDNKEEFHHLETYLHHYHDDKGHIKSSPLSGDPPSDIQFVLEEVATFVSALEN